MDKEPLVDMIWAILPAGGSVVNESKKPQKSQGLILSGESVQTHFFMRAEDFFFLSVSCSITFPTIAKNESS